MTAAENAKGLKSGLKRENGKSQAPEGSAELEGFLKLLEDELIKQTMDETERNNMSESANSARTWGVLEQLREDGNTVVVPFSGKVIRSHASRRLEPRSVSSVPRNVWQFSTSQEKTLGW